MSKFKIKAIIAIAILFLSTAAVAAGPNITTGGKTGTYIKVGNNIARTIGGTVMKSKGGEENINRVLKGEAQVGMAQMDTYAFMSTKNAEVNNVVEIMGPLYKEAVYIVVNTEGRVKSEDDLKEGITIAIGKKGSGGASTWDYMRKLVPYYAGAAVEFKGGIRALGRLAAQPKGTIDAVLFVSKPVMSGKMITTVLNNPNLKFINVNDRRLNNVYKPTGQPIYTSCKIDVQKGFLNDKEVKTICMDAVIFANVDTDEDYLDSLSDLVMNYKSTLLK